MVKDNVIDIALCLLASDETQDWLVERGITGEWAGDAAADLYRERNGAEDSATTFGLDAVRGLIDGASEEVK